MDRPTKQKINEETQTSNDTIDQLDLIDGEGRCNSLKYSHLANPMDGGAW